MPSQTNQSFSRSRPLAVTLKVSQRLRTNTDFPHFCVAAVPASSWTCLPYICYITVSTNDGNYMWLNENTLKAQEMINKDPHMPWRQHQWAMYSKQIKGMFGFILHWGESSQSTNKSLNTHRICLYRYCSCYTSYFYTDLHCAVKVLSVQSDLVEVKKTNFDGVRVTPETDRRCHRRRDPVPAGWHACGSVARGPKWIFRFWTSGASCFLHHHTVK